MYFYLADSYYLVQTDTKTLDTGINTTNNYSCPFGRLFCNKFILKKHLLVVNLRV